MLQTKESLKAKSKRQRKLSMLIVVFLSFLIVPTLGDEAEFEKFRLANPDTVDYSALLTCSMGKADRMQPVKGNRDLGFTCKVKMDVWTENKKQAKEFCESTFPYYIIQSESHRNAETSCTLQINLQCDTGYWQIKGKCYKVTDTRYTYEDAKKVCNVNTPGSKAQIAEYYSEYLRLYFRQMMKISDAWVSVPDMKDYFSNGQKSQAGIYVQEGAFKYDVAMGTILMEDDNQKHQVLCEYTPPMTRAEMFYLAEIYSEIYPLKVYNDGEGAIIPSANLKTIEQIGYNKETNISTFTSENFKKTCMSLGRILNVESFPMTAIEEDHNSVKEHLTQQRFYLTSAIKNDGCNKADYRSEEGTVYSQGDNEQYCEAHSLSFHRVGRFPSMAGMRAPLLCALHSFNWKYTDCALGPEWSEPPVQFTRDDKRVFCHYINNKEVLKREEAIEKCEEFGAALTGFDSGSEFEKVQSKLNPRYPEHSKVKPGLFPLKYFGDKNEEYRIDDHYWLGGQSPCTNNCQDGNDVHVASWDNAVAVNTNFLNKHNHEGADWKKLAHNGLQYISFRSDKAAFHVHPKGVLYIRMFYICGKSAPLEKILKTGNLGRQ